MFALFPIILGSSIVIMHPRIGGKATASVIERAKLVLAQLEAEDRLSPARKLIDDLPLFAAARPAAPAARDDSDTARIALVEALAALHPDEMSPRQALEALYALKAKLPKPK